MVEHNINILQENQFAEVVNIIQQHRCHASYAVNKESLLTAWAVGKYVSGKLKNEEWGSKVVSLLSEYIRAKQPDIKGFSRSSIYNMVMFYDEYSTETFTTIVNKYLDAEFVQPLAAQIEDMFKVQINQRNSPLLNYPVADSTLSTIINHTKKLLHTDLHLLVRIQTKK